jgi:hypothetical protein
MCSDEARGPGAVHRYLRDALAAGGQYARNQWTIRKTRAARTTTTIQYLAETDRLEVGEHAARREARRDDAAGSRGHAGSRPAVLVSVHARGVSATSCLPRC